MLHHHQHCYLYLLSQHYHHLLLPLTGNCTRVSIQLHGVIIVGGKTLYIFMSLFFFYSSIEMLKTCRHPHLASTLLCCKHIHICTVESSTCKVKQATGLLLLPILLLPPTSLKYIYIKYICVWLCFYFTVKALGIHTFAFNSSNLAFSFTLSTQLNSTNVKQWIAKGQKKLG